MTPKNDEKKLNKVQARLNTINKFNKNPGRAAQWWNGAKGTYVKLSTYAKWKEQGRPIPAEAEKALAELAAAVRR